ncbi:MAG: electron transport complex subunit RsxE [Lachnospiraceae bacterium]|nr:electron transport complex subunit RsxE [Lachnospiraceae bacterium]
MRMKFVKDSVPERMINGLFNENPTLVMLLGLCPALAVTTSALSGAGMGLVTLIVLTLTNLFISLFRKYIKERFRTPVYIIIIAIFVTIAEIVIKAYFPYLDNALGIYLPLIVLNCIVMNRAKEYAANNNVLLSVFDGIGMGLGFTLALMLIGSIREIKGAGEIFGFKVMPDSYVTADIFVLAPGAFFVLAILAAIMNKLKANNLLTIETIDSSEVVPKPKKEKSDGKKVSLKEKLASAKEKKAKAKEKPSPSEDIPKEAKTPSVTESQAAEENKEVKND